ncbi:hypothetical protein TraAM80_04102 [Trypanosoma rangeli]|uniref:Integral membrane protein n=1 Tax=Trypanosoma rangeli TaxID=5698 RepID=A0A3R7L265_TRYRA|nr:uncharacterized protein TraAM80_04102 [Trypanosoma rangeli]RNF06106.1 hypothetical protein TraAM80_04102 [Trypanosoma rangeli]|eukprot:RNF06106.1 hypothetical protein TraAM80_04102 [Trypanosoma rangeli]
MPESERLKEARRAFGDVNRSRESHDRRLEDFNVDIRKNSALRNRSLVLSSFAGLVTAAGVFGATSGLRHVNDKCGFPTVITGQLLLQSIAGGGAVAYTACLALSFERTVYDVELKRELWEIENHLAGEIQEMVAIYKSQGLSEGDALTITRIFARHREPFANLMMVEELGYSRLEPPCRREAVVDAALPAAVGYTMGCLLPLAPLLARHLCASRVQVLVLCMLTTGGVFVSVAQSEVFYGSYVSNSKVLKVIACNLSAMGAVFGAARAASQFFSSVWQQ